MAGHEAPPYASNPFLPPHFESSHRRGSVRGIERTDRYTHQDLPSLIHQDDLSAPFCSVRVADADASAWIGSVRLHIDDDAREACLKRPGR